jgi:hypothetical protein
MRSVEATSQSICSSQGCTQLTRYCRGKHNDEGWLRTVNLCSSRGLPTRTTEVLRVLTNLLVHRLLLRDSCEAVRDKSVILGEW